MAEARGYNKGAPSLHPSASRAAPHLPASHPASLRLRRRAVAARTRSLVRPLARTVPLRRVAAYTLLCLPLSLGIGKGRPPVVRAGARVERKKIGRADDGGWSSYRSR